MSEYRMFSLTIVVSDFDLQPSILATAIELRQRYSSSGASTT